MTLRITPFDTVFFRDGKPFMREEESWADGLFPPPPSVLLGALRSAAIAQQLQQEPLNTLIALSESISVAGTWLHANDKQLFPAPLDLFKADKDALPQSMPLQKIEFESNIPSNLSHVFLPEVNGKQEEASGKWIEKSTLTRYFQGNEPLEHWYDLNALKTEELKTGIGRNDEKHTAQDGQLYRYQMQRTEILNPHSGLLDALDIIVQFENLPKDFADNGMLQLGGERKAAAYTTEKEWKLPPSSINSRIFKLVLLTPGIFSGTEGQAWWPEKILAQHGLKLLAAATGKPWSTGGFDMVLKKPKPMRKVVPAGSVYVVEADPQTDLSKLVQALHGTSLCDQALDAKQGFGIALVAALSGKQKTLFS